jgi:hypothetical protein
MPSSRGREGTEGVLSVQISELPPSNFNSAGTGTCPLTSEMGALRTGVPGFELKRTNFKCWWCSEHNTE